MSTQLINTAQGFRDACDAVRRSGRSLGLVPTMGALHEGHASLIRAAKQLADEVAVSIFVNPTQFGQNEDFGKYPKTLDRDREVCERSGATLVFAPSIEEMYPAGESTRVTVTGVSSGLCGATRPGHFDGVATIVTKFFVLAGPCTAVFGKKDYQQLKVIERFARDLLLPVTIVGHPIVRDVDAVALSSRNNYLSPSERARAQGIVRGLSAAHRAFAQGERQVSQLTGLVLGQLSAQQLSPQYVEVVDAETLQRFEPGQTAAPRCLLAVAAFCGTTRLIDNVVLGEDPDPILAAAQAHSA